MLRYGRNPAATVYDSIGPDFFLALDEGWLNLGLWEGDGADPAEAPSRGPPARPRGGGAAAARAATSSTSGTGSARRTP